MPTGCSQPGAGLKAVEDLVKRVSVAWRWTPMSAPIKPPVAGERAPALWAELVKVEWPTAQDRCFRVSWAAQTQTFANPLGCCQLLMDLGPHRNVCTQICFDVADEIHAMLGPAEKDVDAVLGFEKSHLGALVASDQAHDNNLAFLALKIVASRDSDRLRQLLLLQAFSRSCLFKAVLRQALQVSFAQENLKVFAQRSSKLLKLTRVWGQQCNITVAVPALTHEVADERSSHCNLAAVAVGFDPRTIVSRVFVMGMVPPKQIVSHADNVGKAVHRVVVF